MLNSAKKYAIEKYIFIIVIALFFLSFGYVLGNNINAYGAENKVVSNSTSTQIDLTKLTLLNEVKSIIDEKYSSPKATPTPPTMQDVDRGITAGYVNSYNDEYTRYFPPVEAKSFEENVKGAFGGIGVEVTEKDGYIQVISPLKDSPAEKAGLVAGDLIMNADGHDLANLSVEQAVSYIRGEVGTEVTLKVYTKSKKNLREVKMKRDTIKIPTVSSETIKGVYVIHLYNFSESSAQLFKDEMDKFLKSGSKKLVIDLRGNPGGYLESAVNIASFFLDEGKMVVEEKGNAAYGIKDHRAKPFKLIDSSYSVNVIIDEGSASASEILAGALQDHGVARVYGKKSYGKGSVQEYINLENNGALKVTVANWYTPNGRNITADKIVPDVLLERTDKTTYATELAEVVRLINLDTK